MYPLQTILDSEYESNYENLFKKSHVNIYDDIVRTIMENPDRLISEETDYPDDLRLRIVSFVFGITSFEKLIEYGFYEKGLEFLNKKFKLYTPFKVYFLFELQF